MPQACKVCALGPSTVKDLESDYVMGMNTHQLKEKYGVSYGSVQSHLENHLPERIVRGAQIELRQDSLHLLEKIDELYSWMKEIFQRNYDRKKDGLALKALEAQRGTLELLAKISYALHQNKLAEIEKDKGELLNVDIPIDRLTKEEQVVYFQLLQKLQGDRVTIDVGSILQRRDNDFTVLVSRGDKYEEVEEGTASQSLNILKTQNDSHVRMRRTKYAGTEQGMTFKPIDQGTPPNTRNSYRRSLSNALRSTDEDQSQESLSPTIPNS